MLLRNNTTHTLTFVVNGEVIDGVPQTATLDAGEIADIDVRVGDPILKGWLIIGTVTDLSEADESAPRKRK